jgi:hypothetical protein
MSDEAAKIAEGELIKNLKDIIALVETGNGDIVGWNVEFEAGSLHATYSVLDKSGVLTEIIINRNIIRHCITAKEQPCIHPSDADIT